MSDAVATPEIAPTEAAPAADMSRLPGPWPKHKICMLFPLMEGEEGAGFEESIERNGVQEALQIWTDEKGREWLVDGQNRDTKYRYLYAQGRIDPEKFPLPVHNLGQIPEDEMIGLVMAKNLDRRHLTSSQTAGILVKGNSIWRKHHKAIGGGKKNKSGDLASFLAKRMGTNRSYLFDAEQLNKGAPDLLDEMISGKIAITTAMDTLRERLNQPPRKKPNAKGSSSSPASSNGHETNGSSTPAEAPPPAPVRDGTGKEVEDEKLKPIFEVRSAVGEALTSIKAARAAVKNAASTDGGDKLPVDQIFASLKNATALLNAHQPHAVCPECEGTGKKKEGRGKCDVCEGRKWVDTAALEVYEKLQAAPA